MCFSEICQKEHAKKESKKSKTSPLWSYTISVSPIAIGLSDYRKSDVASPIDILVQYSGSCYLVRQLTEYWNIVILSEVPTSVYVYSLFTIQDKERGSQQAVFVLTFTIQDKERGFTTDRSCTYFLRVGGLYILTI